MTKKSIGSQTRPNPQKLDNASGEPLYASLVCPKCNIQAESSLQLIGHIQVVHTPKEYDLTDAGAFNERDLLELRDSELEKGNSVDIIRITPIQANHLVNSIKGTSTKQTGKKLVDFWETQKAPGDIRELHGIGIRIVREFE